MVIITDAIKHMLLNSIVRCNEVITTEKQAERQKTDPTMWDADFTCVILCCEIVKAIPADSIIPRDEYLELLKAALTEIGNPEPTTITFKKGQAGSMVMMAKNWGINIPAVMAKYSTNYLREVIKP